MDLSEIQIKCQGATVVQIEELRELQGNLKDLSEENYVKLRNSIVQFGFSFPVLLWVDGEGTKWIIDAHQRIRTLRKMQADGYTIPPLPADFVHADSRVDAKKKLLLLNSRYGKITREGFDAFVDEPGFEIGEELEDFLVLPEITVYGTQGIDEEKETDEDEPKHTRAVTCPACQHQFVI